MKNLYKYFSYNFFKIIKSNINNNNLSKYSKNVSDFSLKKEITVVVFSIIKFLVLYVSLKEIYMLNNGKFVFFHILKDNIFSCFIWFIGLSILPLLTIFLNKKRIRCKYYLILLLVYMLSNLFNLIMIIYYISIFISSWFVGLLGIINIIFTVFLNISIIVEIIESNLKK